MTENIYKSEKDSLSHKKSFSWISWQTILVARTLERGIPLGFFAGVAAGTAGEIADAISGTSGVFSAIARKSGVEAGLTVSAGVAIVEGLLGKNYLITLTKQPSSLLRYLETTTKLTPPSAPQKDYKAKSMDIANNDELHLNPTVGTFQDVSLTTRNSDR